MYDIGVSILLLFNTANTGRVEEVTSDDDIFDAKFLKTLHKNREDIELEYKHVPLFAGRTLEDHEGVAPKAFNLQPPSYRKGRRV